MVGKHSQKLMLVHIKLDLVLDIKLKFTAIEKHNVTYAATSSDVEQYCEIYQCGHITQIT